MHAFVDDRPFRIRRIARNQHPIRQPEKRCVHDISPRRNFQLGVIDRDRRGRTFRVHRLPNRRRGAAHGIAAHLGNQPQRTGHGGAILHQVLFHLSVKIRNPPLLPARATGPHVRIQLSQLIFKPRNAPIPIRLHLRRFGLGAPLPHIHQRNPIHQGPLRREPIISGRRLLTAGRRHLFLNLLFPNLKPAALHHRHFVTGGTQLLAGHRPLGALLRGKGRPIRFADHDQVGWFLD